MKTTNQLNPWTRFFWILVVVMIIIGIIFLLLNRGCSKKLASVETDICEIKSILHEHDSLFEILIAENEKMISQNEKIIGKLDTLSNEVSKLNRQVAKSQKREAIIVKEIHSMKNEISKLADKVNSLENGKGVSKISEEVKNISAENLEVYNENESYSSDNFISKKLSFVIMKKVYNGKKSKVLSESNIADYSADLVFVENKGFLENCYSKSYAYLDAESKTQELIFSSLVESKYATIDVNKNGNGLIYINESEFAEGVGGLLVPSGKEFPWETQIGFLEKSIDYNLKRKATWEILGGISVAGIGGFGLWYFNKHPEATITLNDSKGNLVFYDEISNNFGKGVSAGLIGAGTALFTKGIIDKRLAIKVNPTQLTLSYTIK